MTYKPEIDGLRSIAVCSVLLFHLGVPFLTGGFTGVDIFFVISGYLITGIIIDDLQHRRFSLLDFYRRRALRILPPLLLVVAATSVVACVVMLPVELQEYSKTVLWTTLFSSNMFFYSIVDYFNPQAKYNPLLHTWSLAVEEQFYIAVPILLFAVFTCFRRFLLSIFVATVVLSFSLSAILVEVSQSATFYLLPTRYWEMGAGSLIALFQLHQCVRGRPAEIVSIIGIVLIGTGLFFISDMQPFPGPIALLPVLGACALLMAGQNGIVGRLLAKPLPIFIGKISYSLYLWHWPLIVFWRLWVSPDITGWSGLLLGVTSFLLAIASYYCVEQPFRHGSWSKRNGPVLAGAALGLGLIACLGFLVQQVQSVVRPLPEDVKQIAAYDDYDATAAGKAQYRINECFITSGTRGGINAFNKDVCLDAEASPNQDYLLIGDSQAADLWQALQTTRPDTNFMQATASGCRPTLTTDGEERCQALMSFILKDWIPSRRPEAVILSARWRPDDIEALQETIAYLSKSGVTRIIVFGPTVEYAQSLPLILARASMSGSDGAEFFRDDARRLLDLRMAHALSEAGVTYVSLYDAICPRNRCVEMIGKTPVQSDYGHFTDVGARWVAERIASKL